MKFIEMVFGPGRKERRAASSEARNNKVASRTARRMARPEKQEMLADGFMKIDDFFHIRTARHA